MPGVVPGHWRQLPARRHGRQLVRQQAFCWRGQFQRINHLAAVEALASKLVDYDATTTGEVLILITADKIGPYTIIDGTHRAAALYRNHLTEPNLPWLGLLAVDPAMAGCQWHIESDQAEANIRAFRQLRLLGALR